MLVLGVHLKAEPTLSAMLSVSNNSFLAVRSLRFLLQDICRNQDVLSRENTSGSEVACKRL
jgi:hypothetical protein